MANISKSAKWFKQVAETVQRHDERCRFGKKAYAVRMCYFDIEDVGWEIGDIVYPGVKLESGAQQGHLEVICGGDHKSGKESEVEADVPEEDAVEGGYLDRVHQKERELVEV